MIYRSVSSDSHHDLADYNIANCTMTSNLPKGLNLFEWNASHRGQLLNLAVGLAVPPLCILVIGHRHVIAGRLLLDVSGY